MFHDILKRKPAIEGFRKTRLSSGDEAMWVQKSSRKILEDKALK